MTVWTVLIRKRAKRTAFAVTVLFILMFALLFYQASSPHLSLWGYGELREGASPQGQSEEPTLFALPIWINVSSRLPVTIREIRVMDVTEERELFPKCYVYDFEGELRGDMGVTGPVTAQKFYTDYGPSLHAPGTFQPEGGVFCIFQIYETPPPPRHVLEVTVEYDLFDLFSRIWNYTYTPIG